MDSAAEVERDNTKAGVSETVMEAANKAGDKASELKEAGKKRAESTKDIGAKELGSLESDITKKIDSDVFRTNEFLDIDESREDAAHKGDVKNFEGSEFDVLTNTSEFDVTKKIDSDVLKTDEFPATGDHVKNADEEVGDALRDTVGRPFGATKEKTNEAGENVEEKTKAAGRKLQRELMLPKREASSPS